jgi:hypothetical protein
MTELEKQLSINYYQWAKSEFRREFDEGFPLLSTLRCRASLTVHEFISTLPDDEQWRFALALLRRGVHREAAKLCGEPLSDMERELLDRYEHRTKKEYFYGTFWSIGPSEKETKIAAAIEKRKLLAQRSNKLFRGAVLRRVTEILGAPNTVEAQGANAAIILTTTIGDWTVWTNIGCSTKIPLSYSHTLINARDPELKRYPSFLAWLGIMGNTTWDLLTTDVADEAIETLVMLCQRFLSEAPQWLPRLSA